MNEQSYKVCTIFCSYHIICQKLYFCTCSQSCFQKAYTLFFKMLVHFTELVSCMTVKNLVRWRVLQMESPSHITNGLTLESWDVVFVTHRTTESGNTKSDISGQSIDTCSSSILSDKFVHDFCNMSFWTRASWSPTGTWFDSGLQSVFWRMCSWFVSLVDNVGMSVRPLWVNNTASVELVR